jgi:cell wall-associated NlpC family hydrolase
MRLGMVIISMTLALCLSFQAKAQFADSTYFQTFSPNLSDSILDFGKRFLGTPYRYGGSTPGGFDCSGFVSYVFSHYQIALPRSSRSYLSVGTSVATNELQPGDILLFKGRNLSSSTIGHVSVVVEVTEKEIFMLHSSTSRGVLIEDYKKFAYYTKRYLGARRVLPKS